LDPK
jgi:hypothetical protein